MRRILPFTVVVAGSWGVWITWWILTRGRREPGRAGLTADEFRDHARSLFEANTPRDEGGRLGRGGRVVLEFFWWGAVFLLAVPVMALLLILGPRFLPEYRDPDAGRPDLTSAVLSLAAVLAVIFGLKLIAQDGLALLPVLSVVAGLAIGRAFVGRQRTLEDPFIDLGLFRSPAFSASLATYGIGILLDFGDFRSSRSTCSWCWISLRLRDRLLDDHRFKDWRVRI